MAKKSNEPSSKSTDKLWAPWRIRYIARKKEKGCVFCNALKHRDDTQRLILHRDTHCFVILNLYPYNNGHLMVVPNRHIAQWEDLTEHEVLQMHRLTARSLQCLKKSIHPHGFNLGVNLGLPAGAGIADHIHTHIVPRWNGDTNFMPVTADTKVISQSLTELYRILRKIF